MIFRERCHFSINIPSVKDKGKEKRNCKFMTASWQHKRSIASTSSTRRLSHYLPRAFYFKSKMSWFIVDDRTCNVKGTFQVEFHYENLIDARAWKPTCKKAWNKELREWQLFLFFLLLSNWLFSFSLLLPLGIRELRSPNVLLVIVNIRSSSISRRGLKKLSSPLLACWEYLQPRFLWLLMTKTVNSEPCLWHFDPIHPYLWILVYFGYVSTSMKFTLSKTIPYLSRTGGNIWTLLRITEMGDP